ncbi:PREDICTED: uncharacterized protein LOC106748670 [Dinoponera quadriceps]|uniref:Uncharacterized protein LOC106748670 n=1 Tax=Dinoponera quadriceps TaxID=609295 RepID=A0A6P3XWH2_DINQU|nr:PREDICTED: uncharacterized protein LOC106748670 [Dinoponera quadriceps]XP_014482911.1 PREDICTED: uncharacterized protein LOC106748670 [Dinoponera quadriceps]
MSIDLCEAKEHFIELMRSLNRNDQQKFLSFIVKEWEIEPPIFYDHTGDDIYDCGKDNDTDYPIFMLNTIVSDIKQKVPFNAILPSENIIKPSSGLNSDCDSNITFHMDLFLYDDDDLIELENNEQLQRYYCLDCGSRNIEPLIYISHSISRKALCYMFKTCLPKLKDKTILDVGSRLGAVLYGAYVYTDAPRIIGVEMNEELCNLQNDITRKYKMDDRITVFHNRIEGVPEVIEESDVIILNNPFEFYLPEDVQIDIWKFLRATIKKGTILVTCPSIEVTFKTLQLDDSIETWLKPCERLYSNKFPDLHITNGDEFSNMSCYEVL